MQIMGADIVVDNDNCGAKKRIACEVLQKGTIVEGMKEECKKFWRADQGNFTKETKLYIYSKKLFILIYLKY